MQGSIIAVKKAGAKNLFAPVVFQILPVLHHGIGS
jgi:hypothetical protein